MLTTHQAGLKSSTPVTPEVDWIERARAVLPAVIEAAPEIDRTQRLPDPLLAALHEQELFRMLLPKELGGYELNPAAFCEVIETVATGDASTAWIISQCTVCTMAMAYLPPETGQLIVGDDPAAVLAWGAMPNGQAIREGDGWRITGHWFFASGSRHATWMGGRAPLRETDGTPILDESGQPIVRMFLFPKSEATIHSSWDVIGLRGTGSDSYSVEDLYVPGDRQFDVNVTAPHDGTLYKVVNRHLYGPGVAAVSLGLSRAMLDALIKVASDPKKTALRDSTAVLSGLGMCEARWRSSRTALYASLNRMWADLEAGGEETDAHQIDIRCAATLAVHEAKTIVDFVFHEAGAAAILESLPFERRVRDMAAILQHGQSKRTNMETVGRYMLGMDTGPLIL